MWLKTLMTVLGLLHTGLMSMHCDNKLIIQFHERTKHSAHDCIMSEMICTMFTPSKPLADIFTKTISSKVLLDIM